MVLRKLMMLTLLVGAAVNCSNGPLIRPSLKDAPTHERYSEALEDFGLTGVALGRDWLQAAARALETPVPASSPFAEAGYFGRERPAAVAYSLELRRGRRLVIDVRFESAEPARLFVDLFERRDQATPRRVAGLEPGATGFEYDVRRDGTYVLRLQPELLRSGRYSVTERSLASIRPPIKGFALHDVRSGFGAPRDGGARDHHGIDIFRPRGTPVVAAVDGTVQRDESERGGRVIWLRDARTGRHLYYAHLSDWAVESGTRVSTGDVIGYVGNTGNARTTPPHLHFGVYERGPADPVPFLTSDDPAPRPPSASIQRLGEWMRIARGPERGTAVRVFAAMGSHYRVELPDGRLESMRAGDLVPTSKPVRLVTVSGVVLEAPTDGAPIVDVITKPRELAVLAEFGDYSLVRLPNEQLGWLVRRGD